MQKIENVSHELFEIEFEKFLNSLIERVKIKSKEYAPNTDPFHNFNVGAEIENQDPRVVLHGFMLKHLISYFDHVTDLKNGGLGWTSFQSEEKLGDIITYLVIHHIANKAFNNDFDPVELPF